MKTKITIFAIAFLSLITNAQSIEKFSIDSGGDAITVNGIEIFYTIGEVNVQELSAGGISISEGFISPELKLKINLLAFLQGASLNPNTGEESLMRDDLRVGDLLTNTSPYQDNLTCDASVFDAAGDNAIVDWVWVELRDKGDNTTVVDSQSALLQRDGDVVDIDGTSALSFNAPTDSYFVVVSHRNHLGIISANTFALSSTITTVDLSSSSVSIDGGTNAVVLLDNGKFALYAGDFDGNGQVQNTDLTNVRPQLGQPADYSNADIDMNGQVQNTDINNLLNPNQGKGTQFVRTRDLKLYAKRKQ